MIKFLVSVSILGFYLSGVQLVIVRRQYHDGILYEDYAPESDNLRYTVTGSTGWDDLDLLAETSDLLGKAMFCSRGPGAWLLYPDKAFGFGMRRQLKLLYGEYCVPLDTVNSIQPVGGLFMNTIEMSAAIGFTEKYFGALGTPIKGDETQSVKSVIFLGNARWTVDDGSGNTFCVSALGMDGDVCLIENVRSAFSTSADEVSVKRDCDENLEVYNLQSCYAMGYHVITYEIDLSLAPLQAMCSATGYDSNDQTKEKFLEVVQMWKYRMQPLINRNSAPIVIPPEKQILKEIPFGEDRYKILTYMEDIVSQTCPSMSSVYLDLLTEIYLFFHAKNGEIWKEETTPDGTRLERNPSVWENAVGFLEHCYRQVSSSSGGGSVYHTGCNPRDTSVMRLESQIESIEDFLNGESYDFILEQLWLVLNYVTPYCTKVAGFADNYWSEFPLLVKKEFLYPVREQWKNPGKRNTYYAAMFNGFDLEKTRLDMISCVQAMIMNTPSYDPLARPPGFLVYNDSSVKDIVGNAITKAPASKPDGDRRKRQRLESESDEIDPNYNPDAITIIPIALPKISPPTATEAVADEVIADKPKPVGRMASTVSTSTSTTTSTTTESPSLSATDPALNENLPKSKSGKKKKKHPKKGKKGKSGKRKHSKFPKNKAERLHGKESSAIV